MSAIAVVAGPFHPDLGYVRKPAIQSFSCLCGTQHSGIHPQILSPDCRAARLHSSMAHGLHPCRKDRFQNPLCRFELNRSQPPRSWNCRARRCVPRTLRCSYMDIKFGSISQDHVAFLPYRASHVQATDEGCRKSNLSCRAAERRVTLLEGWQE